MDKNKVTEALKKLRADSKERKFKQTVDLIFNIKDIDLKKTDNHVDFFHTIPHLRGKKVKVCALIDNELKAQSDKVMDKTILASEFSHYQGNKGMLKKLAKSYDFFVAQATIMPKVAQAFGKVLGTRGKMPNPKAGCVVPPSADLSKLHQRLQKLVRISVKTSPIVHTFIGREDMSDEELVANTMSIYDALIHHLPNETNNLASIYLKLTMCKPVRLDKAEVEKTEEKKQEVPKKEMSEAKASEHDQKSLISDKPVEKKESEAKAKSEEKSEEVKPDEKKEEEESEQTNEENK